MKNGIILFMGGLAIFAIILSVFSLLKTDQPIGKNSDTSKLNILGNNNNSETEESPMPTQSNSKQPEMEIDETKKYVATVTTSEGDIVIELNARQTPVTVNNFVHLARKGFYDDTIFHRAIEGFMIQGGDPTGTGAGGPGYKFDDEPFEGEYERGTVAMANAGPDTNGSQFFIMHQAEPGLPKDYTIFGKVIEGMETVDAIATADVTTSPSGERSKPVKPAKIISVTIEETEGEASAEVPSEDPSSTTSDTE